MEGFEIMFTLGESSGSLEKIMEEAIMDGKEYGYSKESIIEIALSEYDVFIYCQGKEVFNATVHFNEFLYELLRFAFYAMTGEVPKNMRSYGWSFKSSKELPDWLEGEVRTLREILGKEFEELTSSPFLRSFLGSYDPILIVYGFRKEGYLYFVSVDYKKVCRILTKEFEKIAIKTIEEAIQELEQYVPIFEENGLKEYQEMINDYKRLLKNLRESSRTLEKSKGF